MAASAPDTAAQPAPRRDLSATPSDDGAGRVGIPLRAALRAVTGVARARYGRASCALLAALVVCIAPSAGVPAEGRGLAVGVNGHDNWTAGVYRRYPAERVFALLRENGISTYRVDVGADARSVETLSRLVALGRPHGIAIRPMLYVDSVTADDVYRIVKMFAADIRLWELGNELNLRGETAFAENIARMIVARRGVERAAAETGLPLQSAINVTAFAGTGNQGLDAGRTTYPFLDRAVAMGLAFEVVTYHYYPAGRDRTGGWIRAYLDPLRKYGKPVIVTETNCAEIYAGDDGNSERCAATLAGFLEEIEGRYADLVSEVVLYELFDDPDARPEAERHFGLLFDIERPKRTLSVARRFARPADARTGGDRAAGRSR